MTKRLLMLFGLFALTAGGVLCAQQAKHHVVFAITSPDPADWMLTAGNIHNLKQGMSPEPVDIEVVVYGPAIVMVKKDSSAAEQLQGMMKDGAVILACENSMHRAQIAKADLPTGVGTVPSGVVEVVRKQEAGWSYVKAGK